MGTDTQSSRTWRGAPPSIHPWVIACVAIVVRAGWCAWAWHAGVRPASDARWYYERGLEFAIGHGYALGGNPTAYWPVGYPAFLGGLFTLFGDSIPIAMAANVLFGLAIVESTRRLALQFFDDRRLAATAAMIVSLHPNAIAYTSLLMGETLSTALLLWSLVLLLDRDGKLWRMGAAAVLLGAAILVRPQLAPIPLVVAVAIRFIDRRSDRNHQLVRTAVTYVGALFVLLPWTIRNQQLYGAWPIVSNNDGINFHIGNNDRANGTYYLDFVVEAAYWEAPDEHQRNRTARAVAAKWIVAHPWRFLALLPKKVWYLWRADTDGFTWNRRWFDKNATTPVTRAFDVMKWGSQLWWVALIAIAGLAVWRRRVWGDHWSWAGLAIVVWVTLMGMIYFGDGRFHYVAVPFIAIYAARGLGRPLTATHS